jgi:hypothetical protein
MTLARRWPTALLLASAAGLAAADGLVITRPAPAEVVHDNAGRVGVAVAIEDGAALPPGYALRLLLDGVPAAPDRRTPAFELEGVERGEHRLQALIVDADGRVLTRSPSVDFTVWRASRQQPGGR